MEFNFTPGQKLILELENDVFEGTYESGTKERIDINDVSEYSRGNKIPGILSFYKCEIKSFKILNKENVNVVKISNNTPDNIIKLEENQYKKLEKNMNDYIYICTMDKRYYDLINLIKDCEYLSIAGLHSTIGRSSQLSLLVIVVINKAYIIDLQLFNKKNIPSEINEILQSDSILKVTFGGRSLVDSLFHCHNVKTFNNVFDIEVADLLVQKNINKEENCKLKSLSECLQSYLNFPKSLIEVDSSDIYKLNWEERPLSSSIKKIAVQQCIYLMPLKKYIEKLILNNLYEATNNYYDDATKMSPLSLAKMIYEKNVPDLVLQKL